MSKELSSFSLTTEPTDDDFLPQGHYLVDMTYDTFPSLVELNEEFGEHRECVAEYRLKQREEDLNNFLHQRWYTRRHAFGLPEEFKLRRWKLDPSCVGMDRTPGYRAFFVKNFSSDWNLQKVLAWAENKRTRIAPYGYRPATHEELYEFYRKVRPVVWRWYSKIGPSYLALDVLAVGSSIQWGPGRDAMVITHNLGVTEIRSRYTGGGWTGDSTFLFIPRDGPIEDIDTSIEEWIGEIPEAALPDHHYPVEVHYSKWSSSYPEIHREHRMDNLAPVTQILLLKKFEEELDICQIIAWADGQRTQIAPDGYRPANFVELDALYKEYPDLYPSCYSSPVAIGQRLSNGKRVAFSMSTSICLFDDEHRKYEAPSHIWLFVRK